MLKYSEITSPCSVCSCCKQSASWSRFLRDYRTKGARVPIPDKAVTRDSLDRFFLISGNPRSGCQWGHSDALVALKTQAHLARNIASRPEHPWTHLLNVFAISDLQVHEFWIVSCQTDDFGRVGTHVGRRTRAVRLGLERERNDRGEPWGGSLWSVFWCC